MNMLKSLSIVGLIFTMLYNFYCVDIAINTLDAVKYGVACILTAVWLTYFLGHNE